MGNKTCTMCGIEKSLTDFWIRKDRGQHYAECKACKGAKNRRWLRANPHKNKEYENAWKARSPDRVKEVWREMKRRQRRNPANRFTHALRTAVAISLKGGRKRRPTYETLGYTLEALRSHLERQFTKGMTWENYGEWHVDHIIPLAAFNITGPECEDFRTAWGLPNLRPLWASENIRKKASRVTLL